MIVGIFDGIIGKFNEKFPRQAVKKFDKITAVNGKLGTANEMRRHRESRDQVKAFDSFSMSSSSS